jgi:hypothetical protein
VKLRVTTGFLGHRGLFRLPHPSDLITRSRTLGGWLCLAAVIDWFSRYVVSEVSHARHGMALIFSRLI